MLTLINRFTGTAWYVTFNNLVIIHYSVSAPGDHTLFAVMPSHLIPITMQFNSAWLQYQYSNVGQIIGSITIRPQSDANKGVLQIRDWNGGNLAKDTICRGSLVYFIDK